MKVKGKTCYAYFRGSDGKGTCDTDCQWWIAEYFNNFRGCPMWIDRKKWDTKDDIFTRKKDKEKEVNNG